MPSSHFLLLHVFGQIVELDKKRNTNREALRALKKEGASGLKSTYCMFGQSIKFPLAWTNSPPCSSAISSPLVLAWHDKGLIDCH